MKKEKALRKKREKMEYRKPNLTEYGKLKEITKGAPPGHIGDVPYMVGYS